MIEKGVFRSPLERQIRMLLEREHTASDDVHRGLPHVGSPIHAASARESQTTHLQCDRNEFHARRALRRD